MAQQLSIVVLGVILLSTMTYAQMPCDFAQMLVADNGTHKCDMGQTNSCNKVMFVITGFASATNIGAHVSTMTKQCREGVDCFIPTRKSVSRLRCREMTSDSVETYELDLGLQR